LSVKSSAMSFSFHFLPRQRGEGGGEKFHRVLRFGQDHPSLRRLRAAQKEGITCAV